jgi:type II secretory pathway pseudopilin PulG
MDKAEHGFLLMEVLIAFVILSVGIVACMAVMGQVLRFTKASEQASKSLWDAELFLTQLETGERQDLILFGGKFVPDKTDYQYVVKTGMLQALKEKEELGFRQLEIDFCDAKRCGFKIPLYLPEKVHA